MTCADVNCNCKGGHQQDEGEVPAPPRLQAKGKDGEWKMQVSKKNQKSQKQRKREQARRTPLLGSARVPQSVLKLFKTIEPDHVKAVNADDRWDEIEFALDSKATETVMGEDMLSSVEIKDGTASKRGMEYEIATGRTHSDLVGEISQAASQKGLTRSITAQVCAVKKKSLVERVRRCDAGWHLSVFDQEWDVHRRQGHWGKDLGTDGGGMFMVKKWVNRKAFFFEAGERAGESTGILEADGEWEVDKPEEEDAFDEKDLRPEERSAGEEKGEQAGRADEGEEGRRTRGNDSTSESVGEGARS